MLLIDGADGQNVRHVHIVIEFDHLLDACLHKVKPLHIDRCACRAIAIDVDSARHTTHQVVGMRVFAPKDGVYFDPFLL